MAKSTKKRSARRPRRPRLTADAARARTDKLRKRHVPIACAPESLDGPTDPDVQIAKSYPRHHVALMLDGQNVSELYVMEYLQQIGSSVVRMGGIADVVTREDHRFRGYMQRVLQSALYWMRREGFDASMLYGIRSFYPKHGYAPAFPRIKSTLAVRDAETVSPAGHRFEPFSRRHLRAVLKMYHANNATRTGPIRRDATVWEPFRKGAAWHSKARCQVALDGRGRPAGYVVYDTQHLTATVIEVGYATPRVFADVLLAAARRALSQRLERIELVLPEDDAFLEFCKPLGMHKETRYLRDGEAMVRMINVPGALTRVAPELASRMCGSGRLNIRTNLEGVCVAWSRGGLRVAKPQGGTPPARMPQWALAQLLYGYRTAAGLAAAGVLRTSKAGVDILGEMFPARPHFHYSVDYF